MQVLDCHIGEPKIQNTTYSGYRRSGNFRWYDTISLAKVLNPCFFCPRSIFFLSSGLSFFVSTLIPIPLAPAMIKLTLEGQEKFYSEIVLKIPTQAIARLVRNANTRHNSFLTTHIKSKIITKTNPCSIQRLFHLLRLTNPLKKIFKT